MGNLEEAESNILLQQSLRSNIDMVDDFPSVYIITVTLYKLYIKLFALNPIIGNLIVGVKLQVKCCILIFHLLND